MTTGRNLVTWANAGEHGEVTAMTQPPRAPMAVARTLVAALVAVLVGVLVAPPASADQPADDVAAQVNAQRAANGLGSLARDPALDAAATAWAQHMAATGTFEHSTNAFRTSYASPGWTSCCGENIAAGYTSASAAMAAWMASSGHRANILGSYTRIGVGHVTVSGSPYGQYWVQVFATYPAGTVVTNPADAAFIKALYRDMLGREGSDSEVSGWVAGLARGMSRYQVAMAMATTPEWITTVVTRFYQDTLGRAPDSAGLSGWVSAARSGMPVAQIAAAFYGSDEYRRRSGSDEAWIRDLYRALLFREPDAAGQAYWLGRLRAGMPAGQIAYAFYQSSETGRVRVEALYQDLLGRAGDAAGVAHWTPIVLKQGDLALAASLASSQEYYLKASR